MDCPADKNIKLILYDCKAPARTIDPYVVYQLKKYHDDGAKIVFLAEEEFNDAELHKLDGLVDGIQNPGRLKTWICNNRKALVGIESLILTNNRIYGPFFPLQPFFDEMSKRDCDFWGIAFSEDPSCLSFSFLCLKKTVFTSPAFSEYWSRPQNLTADDGVSFSRAMISSGFHADAYCKITENNRIPELDFRPPFDINIPEFLILRYRIPFVRHESFVPVTQNHFFNKAGEIMRAIRDAGSDYPLDLITSHQRRTGSLSLQKNLLGTVIITSHGASERMNPSLKVAVLAHFFYPDLFDELLSYLQNFPFSFDFMISTSSDENAAVLRNKIYGSKLPVEKLVIRVVVNRGRDIGPWLTSFNDLQEQYDLILKIHSKKSGKIPEMLPYEWGRHIYDSLMGSPAEIRNIVSAFEREPQLGIVFPAYPPVLQVLDLAPWFAGPDPDLMNFWIKRCCKGHLPPEEPGIPMFPAGTMFWYRPKALSSLFHCNFSLEEFPPEPFPADGSKAHGLERAIPYIAQGNGYYFRVSISTDAIVSAFQRYEDNIMTRPWKDELKFREIDRLNEVIRDYENSFCWRITKPVRLLADAVKKLLKKSGAR